MCCDVFALYDYKMNISLWLRYIAKSVLENYRKKNERNIERGDVPGHEIDHINILN